MRKVKQHVEDNVRHRSDSHIEEIEPYRERMEDTYDQNASEDRISLVQEYEQYLLPTLHRLSRFDPETPFKKAVRELEKSIGKSYEKSRQEIEDNSILMFKIKEIVVLERRSSFADKAPDESHQSP